MNVVALQDFRIAGHELHVNDVFAVGDGALRERLLAAGLIARTSRTDAQLTILNHQSSWNANLSDEKGHRGNWMQKGHARARGRSMVEDRVSRIDRPERLSLPRPLAVARTVVRMVIQAVATKGLLVVVYPVVAVI